MTPARKKAQEIVGSCTCHEGYTSRQLRDPSCAWCEHGAAVEDVIEQYDKIKAKYDRLLAAARMVSAMHGEGKHLMAMVTLRGFLGEIEEGKP